MSGRKLTGARCRAEYQKGKNCIITISVPEKYLDYFDLVVYEWGLYPSRSEAIRNGIRTQIKKDIEHMKSIDDVLTWKKLIVKKHDIGNKKLQKTPDYLERNGIKVIRRLEY